jgi:hypothetical protein
MANVPIITLLARCPATARRTQSLLCSPSLSSVFNLRTVHEAASFANGQEHDDDDDDLLNQVFPNASFIGTGTIPLGLIFDSTASQCQNSGTIIHIVAPLNRKSAKDADITLSTDEGLLELLSITNLFTTTDEKSSNVGGCGGDDTSDTDSSSHQPQPSTPTSTSILSRVRTSVAMALQRQSSSLDIMTRNGLKLRMQNLLGRQISAQDLVGRDINLPLMQFPTATTTSASKNSNVILNSHGSQSTRATGGLREVVIPYFEEGTSLMWNLSQAGLPRPTHTRTSKPIIGLYEWPSSREYQQQVVKDGHGKSSHPPRPLVIRPLPAAQADFALSVPSLVFQCPGTGSSDHDKNNNSNDNDNNNHEHHPLDNVSSMIKELGGVTSKVGYGGCAGTGQLMVHHPALRGLDVRLCAAPELSSAFDEAQQSLLAASLEDLQNSNVVSEGGGGDGDGGGISSSPNRATSGLEKTGKDCWVEFRANMKQPSGFSFTRQLGGRTTRSRPRVAKAPDIPYE